MTARSRARGARRVRAQFRRTVAAGPRDRPGICLRHQLERVDRRPVHPRQHAAPRHRAGDVRRRVRRGIQSRHRADERRPRRQLLLPDDRRTSGATRGHARSRRSSPGRSRSTAASTTGRRVQPEYRDTDRRPRSSGPSRLGQDLHYVNTTGATTSWPRRSASTHTAVSSMFGPQDKLTSPAEPNWMLLFIDADQNPKTGWLGYDLVANRQVPRLVRTTVVERNIGGRYDWGSPVELPFRVAGQRAGARDPPRGRSASPRCRPRSTSNGPTTLQQTGDWSDFTLNGDAAPNDRYNFRAKFQASLP